jgi:hypothetical protein
VVGLWRHERFLPLAPPGFELRPQTP